MTGSGRRGRRSASTRGGGIPPVGIIGPGRAGLGLALALERAGVRVLGVHGRRRKRVPARIVLSVGGAAPWLEEAGVVFLAVRDELLGACVRELHRSRSVRRGQVVLHLSGAVTAEVLAPLRAAGAAVGSIHPLMTVSADPAHAAAHLRGATFALEGDVRAVRLARAIARRLGGVPIVLTAAVKARYHAGAVFASNYVVALLATAEDLLVGAGIGRRAARAALIPLARASLDNVAAAGPARALTGPIARGDVGTVRRHRRELPADLAALYSVLGRATLRLARTAGLGPGRARALLSALGR